MPATTTKIPLLVSVGERDPSVNAGPQTTDTHVVNGIIDQIKGDEPRVVKRPGVAAAYTEESASEGRGIFYWQGDIYTVIDSDILKNGASIHSTMNTSTGKVSFEPALEDSGVLLIQDSDEIYKVTSAGSVTEIGSGGGFTLPTVMVNGIVVLNQFVLVADADGNIYNSSVGNVDSNFTDSINAEIYADDLRAIHRYYNYCLAFGTKTIQIFYVPDNIPSSGSPLSNLTGTFSYIGCASADSIAHVGTNIFWVGRDQQGQLGVYTMEGLSPKKISNSWVSTILSKAQQDDDGPFLQGTGFQVMGHDLYMVSWFDGTDDDGFTLVYDVSVQEWYTWNMAGQETFNTMGFIQPADATNERFALGLEKYPADGSTDIRTFYMGWSTYQDYGSNYTFEVITPEWSGDNDMVKFGHRLKLEGDTVDTITYEDGGDVAVSWKDDDGSYTSARTLSMEENRKTLTRLGSFTNRRHKFTCTTDAPHRWKHGVLTYTQGTHGQS